MSSRKNAHCEDGVRVKLFAGFRDLFGHNELCVSADAAPDIAHLVANLCKTPEQCRGLLTSTGELRDGLIVLINGRSVGLLGGDAAEVQPGDEVALFPPMGGG